MTVKQLTDLIKQKENEIADLRKQIRDLNTIQSKKSQSSYQRQKELNALRGEWAKENLVVGDIIKVTGSRNSSLRKILNTTRYNVIVTCVRFIKDKNEFQDQFHITEHMFDKVTHIYRDGKMVNIKDLLG